MAEDPPHLLDPIRLQGTAGPMSFFESASLGDGAIAVAYADDTIQLSSLRAAVFSKDGVQVQSPTALDTAPGSLASLAVTASTDQTAAVAWVGAGRIGFGTIAPAGPGPIAFIQTSGLSPSDCRIAAHLDLFVLACSMTDTGFPAAAPETYVIKLDRLGAIVDGPLLVTPVDGAFSVVSGITLDGAGDAWVAYREIDPANPATRVTYLAVVDSTGAALSSPRLLGEALTPSAPVSLAPLSGSAGGVIAGLARESPGTGNAEIVLRTFSANNSLPMAEVQLTSVTSSPQTLSIVPFPNSSSEEYLIEWMERRPADQPVGGPFLVRPSIAVVGPQLSMSLAPLSLPVLLPESADFVGGSADFIAVDDGLVLHRLAFAASPMAGPAPEPSYAPAIVVATAVGAFAPLILLEERLRWGLIALFLPFYARLRGEKIMLDSMRRGAIVQLIKDNPGIRFRQLSRRTGIAQGALEHHLRVLQFHGFVDKESVGREVRFYLVGKNPISEEPFSEVRERILAQIRASPGVAHSALAKAMGVRWATLLWHLETLHEQGEVRYRTRRGRRRYWLHEADEN